MKIKLVAASIFAMGAMATSATASANGEITFVGSVVAETCNLVPEIGGSVENTLQLGQAKVATLTGAGAGSVVPFALVQAGDAGCAALVGGADGAKIAAVAWTGNFNSLGLATKVDGANVLLKSVNSKTANTAIKEGALVSEFDANLIDTGLNFTAQLVSGTGATAVGNVSVAAAYTVSYL
ncbi:TPA: hypothetical protein ACX6SL_003840 [Photobacterium damselae]